MKSIIGRILSTIFDEFHLIQRIENIEQHKESLTFEQTRKVNRLITAFFT